MSNLLSDEPSWVPGPGSAVSLAAVGSIASIVAVGSIASIASVGSIASLGSIGSIGSVGSVGSIGSIGGVGAAFNYPVAERLATRFGQWAQAALERRREQGAAPGR